MKSDPRAVDAATGWPTARSKRANGQDVGGACHSGALSVLATCPEDEYIRPGTCSEFS